MRFVKESVLNASVEAVFAFHERPDALELLQPPWEAMRIIQPPASLEVGSVVRLQSRIGLVWVAVVAEHVAYVKNERFEDVMTTGPFRKWHHRHLFFPHEQGCLLRDEIDYLPPLGWLGRVVAPWLIERRLAKMFDYRHDVTRRHLEAN